MVVVVPMCLQIRGFLAERKASRNNSRRKRLVANEIGLTAEVVQHDDSERGDRGSRPQQPLPPPKPQEHMYINEQHHIKRENLEAYLLRAVMSCETKLEFESASSTIDSENGLPDNQMYANIVPHDDTRVLLPLYNNIPHSDYINANYIEGPTRPASFIAAHGPHKEKVGAFWRMVWHANCSAILMLADLKEEQKVKMVQYWPEEESWVIEGVTITPTSITVKMDFVKRTFILSVGNTAKEVKQYQYTAWPDHGVPQTPYGLSQMIKMAYREHNRQGPITVHCTSAGIGRTGTVILVMYLMDQLHARGAVNPSGALTVLSSRRGRLVENMEQYIFAHQLLHELVFGLKSSYVCKYFASTLNTLRTPQLRNGVTPLNQQYQKLKSFPEHLSFKYGNDPKCAHLNRNQDILPADERIVWLQDRGYGIDAQYINVIRINSIDRKDAYLAGEHPQGHTLGKMWRLIYERKVAVWVLLQTFPYHDPEFPDVVCESSDILNNLALRPLRINSYENFDEQNVDIIVTEQGQVVTHKCLVISLKGWPAGDCLPASPVPLLAVLEKAEALSSQQHPLLFTCKDGVTGCGVMAALLLAVTRLKLFQEVDIYRSVATVQQDRHQFVGNLEQYDFLHNAMVAFLKRNRLYSNFQ